MKGPDTMPTRKMFTADWFRLTETTNIFLADDPILKKIDSLPKDLVTQKEILLS